MMIKNTIDFTKVPDLKLLVSSKTELNKDTAKGDSNATTTIGEGLTWIILVVAVVVETAVILAVPYGVQTVVASAWEETL